MAGEKTTPQIGGGRRTSKTNPYTKSARSKEPLKWAHVDMVPHKTLIPETARRVYNIVRNTMPPDEELVAEGAGITVDDLYGVYGRVYRLAILAWWEDNYDAIVSKDGRITMEFVKFMSPVIQPTHYKRQMELKSKQIENMPNEFKVILGNAAMAKEVKRKMDAK